MDSRNGCKRWVKRFVQNLTFMDRRIGAARPWSAMTVIPFNVDRRSSALEGLLSERTGVLHALQSNRGGKALRILGALSGGTESLPPDVYQAPFRGPMRRSLDATAPNNIQSAGLSEMYWIC
jgi:hypothetical protein